MIAINSPWLFSAHISLLRSAAVEMHSTIVARYLLVLNLRIEDCVIRSPRQRSIRKSKNASRKNIPINGQFFAADKRKRGNKMFAPRESVKRGNIVKKKDYR